MEFTHFVQREDSGVEPAIGAMFATGTHGHAAEFLGTTGAGFTRMCTRLRQLGVCFANGKRLRKPYKRRGKKVASPSLAA
ncbi:MAG: hypothetical protein DMG76_12565 [Acidobacteria bacterium]|nr:MAG: hypothetical protein DMG76_12565 [Acidobacteriota bacterium]